MKITSKKDIIERWQNTEGKIKRVQIIDSLINNLPIENLQFVEQIDGYYDLRGLCFDNKTKLKKTKIENIDFSYSNFNCLILEECTIRNVIFGMCDCTEMLQRKCLFERCRFVKSKFFNSGFGIHGGKYDNISFDKSDLRGSMFSYPDFTNCVFEHCNLRGVDFSASHFNYVKFIGRLDDVWFRGENPMPDMRIMQAETKRGFNPMIVDFSDAQLWDITISDNCNLSNVVIPKDGNHHLISNFNKILKYLELEKTSDIRLQKFIKIFIRMYHHKPDMVIINEKNLIVIIKEYYGEESENFCDYFISKILNLSKTL